MDASISSRCSSGEDVTLASDGNDAPKSPETTPSPTEAKTEKATASCARAFVSVQPFKTRDEFLSAMTEDVTEWLNSLFSLDIHSSELMLNLDTGVLLCRLANVLEGLMDGGDEKRNSADREIARAKDNDQEPTSNDTCRRSAPTGRPLAAAAVGTSGSGGSPVIYRENAQRGSFQSRDNISNFLNWCRNRLKLSDTVLFETEDLVAGRNERNVVLCLLEVARRGSKHGMPVPELIELESEIDAQLGKESMAENEGAFERLTLVEDWENGVELEQATSTSGLHDVERSMEDDKGAAMMAALLGDERELELTKAVMDGTTPPSSGERLCHRLRDLLSRRDRHNENPRLKNPIHMDMHSLDELVRRFLVNCKCQHRYPIVKVSEGKYRIGENFMLFFVRMLRNHVMLRIGGGWETLSDYLSRHDPCRAAEQHRRREGHAPVHVTEETTALSDAATQTAKRTPSEEKDTRAEKGKSTQEGEEKGQEKDRNMPTTEEATSGNDETTQENDETQATMDATKQRQHLNLIKANEKISA